MTSPAYLLSPFSHSSSFHNGTGQVGMHRGKRINHIAAKTQVLLTKQALL